MGETEAMRRVEGEAKAECMVWDETECAGRGYRQLRRWTLKLRDAGGETDKTSMLNRRWRLLANGGEMLRVESVRVGGMSTSATRSAAIRHSWRRLREWREWNADLSARS